MNRFVHEENLKHLRAVLARTTDEAVCRRIVAEIEKEEAKGLGGDPRYGNVRS